VFDPLEAMRRLLGQFHAKPRCRTELEAVYGPVWDEQELLRDFDVLGVVDSAVDVHRKADGAHGSLSFQDSPRYYYCWIDVL
jgi:hypothetical protein